MFSFETFIDLPLIWGGLIATAVLLYVLLDGFDLGVGILFPFAPSDSCRSKMMNSVAPFWDGNETWLVLGGGGLLAAFPLAYAIVMPALYVPIITMLLCLIFRGVAFEFRFKSKEHGRKLWDLAFHFGSLGAAFMQGIILGAFIHGIEVDGRAFAGGPFDFLTAFSMMTGLGVTCGYALLGSTWVILKTDKTTQEWARKCAKYLLIFTAIYMAIVSLWVPFLNDITASRWFTMPTLLYFSPIPLMTLALFIVCWRSLHKDDSELTPFLASWGLFLMGFIGLVLSIFPWVVPYQVTVWQAAAVPETLSLLLVGAVIMLPIILIYVGYCYYVFRGKASDKGMY